METTPERQNGFGCHIAIVLLIVALVVVLNVLGLRTGGQDAARLDAEELILRSPAARVFAVALFFAALAGIGLLIIFLARHARGLRDTPSPRIQPSVLLISFLVFLVSFFAISAAASIVAGLVGVDPATMQGASTYLALQVMVMMAAFALGLNSLNRMTEMTQEDPREIGWRASPVGANIAWGVGGYIAALPLLLVGLAISQAVFRDIQTPEHPIVETLLQGWSPYVLAWVLAVVAAPIVEETFFRGMLYVSLRSRMGVWPAAAISGAFFAAIHPTLPAGFLPILALGVVLAVLREKTGSLLPSIVCHGLNNAVALILVRLLY